MTVDAVKSPPRRQRENQADVGLASKHGGRSGGNDPRAAIEAIRMLGDEIVSITVRAKGRRASSIAFDLSGKKAADLVQTAIQTEKGGQTQRLQPNAGLADALAEGFALDGRFTSADDLFDALEKDRRG